MVGACFLAACLGCWGQGGGKETIDIAQDDPEIHQARAQARATLSEFLAALANPAPDQSLFAVKARFAEGEVVECMWLTEVRVEGYEFVGKINNDPGLVQGVAMGDEHRVPINAIEDWMFVQGDQIVGAYSAEVVARRQNDETSQR
ncbi:MAG: DUF2314 domain-containing protein [Planctomycetales bacterium]|nr:DUF2314 domain-containing protein [Planctomycetales bacterium]